ncbi:hypothetical protein HQ590_05465 [bacterium]|nr:hypothetical protein [bacterium]
MAITTADAKKRVVLPQAKPGEVYDVQRQGETRILLVRLEPAVPKKRRTQAACLKALTAAPLQLRMDWPALRQLTREP